MSAERRRTYKSLLDQGAEISKNKDTNDNLTTVIKISEMLLQLENIKDDIVIKERTTAEAVMDTQVVKMNHELMGQVIQKVTTSSFSDDQFTESFIKRIYGPDSKGWDAIAEIVAGIAKTVRFQPCLLGSFDPEPIIIEKSQITRQRREKSRLEEQKRPEEVKQLQKSTKGVKKMNSIVRQINDIYEERNNTPIPYYQLIIDPDDFMHTVDNAFQIAFLVRDGLLVIDIGEDDLPNVRPSSIDERRNTNEKTEQTICSFSVSLFERMKSHYKIKKPMMTFAREVLNCSATTSTQQ